jgi:hypothetical protein
VTAATVRARELLTSSRWLHLLILALPFLVVIVAWHGLTWTFPAFQGADETTHSVIVGRVAARWPQPLLSGYGAWSGPLVYWVLATLARPFGTTLQAVRLVVATFSWGTCVMAYVLFRDRLRARPADALALSLLLAVSPFFLGQSFHVLTDNPAWFFVVLALERCLAWLEKPTLAKVAAFAAAMAAATLMRQITAWLVVPGVIALFSAPLPRRRLPFALALLAAGLVPVAALIVYWGGPLPQSPGAVGAAAVPLAGAYRLRNLLLTLGGVGYYAVFLVPVAEIRAWWDRRGDLRWVLVVTLPAVLALALVAAGALGVVTSFLSLVSRVPFPAVGGASLLWWVLVPLGSGCVVALLVTRWSNVASRILLGSLLALLLSAMANPRWFERYVDFAILLIMAGLVLLADVRIERSDRERWLLAGVIAVASFWLFL